MKKVFFTLRMPLMLIFSGLLSSIPLLFPQLGFFQWISMIPMAMVLIWLAEDKKAKLYRAYGFGMIFYMSFYCVIYHWFFYMYPLDFAGVSNAVSLIIVTLGCVGISFIQAIFSSLGFLVFVAAARTKLVKKVPLLMPLIMAAIWVVAEWWQTIGWWGMPWGKLAIGQVGFGLVVRSAAVFGPYFISFIIVAFNFLIAYAILKKIPYKAKMVAVSIALCLFCLNLGLGTAVTLTYKESDRTVTVAAAQGNIPSGEKWSGGYKSTLELYEKMTVEAADKGAEMIVWPETALPYVVDVKDEIDGEITGDDIIEKVKKIAVDNDITILISTFTVDPESKMQYNSLYEVNSEGEIGREIYSKQKLVPFGEFVPMRDVVVKIFPPLADINMLDSDLKAGEECVVLNGEHGKIGCGICFDSVYETVVLDAVNNDAEIIVLSTNYSWFKNSRALNMHNAHSQLRAIESGRYVVCAANTGISSVIDPMGNVLCEVGVLERDYVVAEAQMRDTVTPYSVIGNAIVYLCAAMPIAFLAVEVVLKIKDKASNKQKIC